jgi:segregation and condensation protein B
MSEEISDWSLKRIVEAILFASQRPVSAKDLQGILKSAAEADKGDPIAAAFSAIREPALRAAIEELGADCADPSRAYELRETAAGWQLVTKPQFAPWLRQLFPEYRSARLSAPAMETLAIIAYRQPITRADIEAIRGVAVDGVLQTLLDRGLVKIAGRAEIPGRPLLYETTQNFMNHFGLRNLDELPNVAELRKVYLPVPASAAGPGVAQAAASNSAGSRDNAPEDMSP